MDLTGLIWFFQTMSIYIYIFIPFLHDNVSFTPPPGFVSLYQRQNIFGWRSLNENNVPPHKTALGGINTKWKHVGKRDKLRGRDVATVSVYWAPSSCDVTDGRVGVGGVRSSFLRRASRHTQREPCTPLLPVATASRLRRGGELIILTAQSKPMRCFTQGRIKEGGKWLLVLGRGSQYDGAEGGLWFLGLVLFLRMALSLSARLLSCQRMMVHPFCFFYSSSQSNRRSKRFAVVTVDWYQVRLSEAGEFGFLSSRIWFSLSIVTVFKLLFILICWSEKKKKFFFKKKKKEGGVTKKS